MKLNELKEAWNSVDTSYDRWYSWPLSFLIRLVMVWSCFIGCHGWETFKTGTRCIWCGKPKQFKKGKE